MLIFASCREGEKFYFHDYDIDFGQKGGEIILKTISDSQTTRLENISIEYSYRQVGDSVSYDFEWGKVLVSAGDNFKPTLTVYENLTKEQRSCEIKYSSNIYDIFTLKVTQAGAN